MVTILPMHHEVLLPLCESLGLESEAPVWGFIAAEALEMVGYCVVAEPEDEDEPCRILTLSANDKYVADGLVRRALHPFYEQGYTTYSFDAPPDVTMLPDYVIIGNGSLPQLFRPCPSS